MTRGEVIQILKILKEDYWDDDGYGHETKEYNDTMLALDMAINAVEQEPILGKIRAEIQENINYNKKMNYQGIVAGLLLTLNIINNYTAGNEPKDSEEENG
jgi:hypothetical protein